MQMLDVLNLATSLRFGAFDVAAASRLGAGPRLREENQDNLVLIDTGGQAVWLQGQQPQRRQLARWRHGHARLAVLDGMGGHGHGREAAEAVASSLLALPPCDSGARSAHTGWITLLDPDAIAVVVSCGHNASAFVDTDFGAAHVLPSSVERNSCGRQVLPLIAMSSALPSGVTVRTENMPELQK